MDRWVICCRERGKETELCVVKKRCVVCVLLETTQKKLKVTHAEFEVECELELELEFEWDFEVELKLSFVLEKKKCTLIKTQSVLTSAHSFCHWQTWFIWAEIQLDHSCQLKWSIYTISKSGKIVCQTNFQNRDW